MDNSVDSIAEITLIFVKKDQEYDYDIMEEFIWECNLDDFTCKIKPYRKNTNFKMNKFEIMNNDAFKAKVLEDTMGFDYRIVGNWNSLLEPKSGLEYYIEECGIQEIYNDYLKDYEEVAKNNLLKDKNTGFEYYKFITLWGFDSWKDEYSGEYDEQLDFLGVLDWNKLKAVDEKEIIKKPELLSGIIDAKSI